MSQYNSQLLTKFDAGDVNKTSSYLTHVISCVIPGRSFPVSDRITG